MLPLFRWKYSLKSKEGMTQVAWLSARYRKSRITQSKCRPHMSRVLSRGYCGTWKWILVASQLSARASGLPWQHPWFPWRCWPKVVDPMQRRKFKPLHHLFHRPPVIFGCGIWDISIAGTGDWVILLHHVRFLIVRTCPMLRPCLSSKNASKVSFSGSPAGQSHKRI